ncbi:hypothetical protein BDR05DRAFT_780947 [Suillus weaverae]|nr:hypothetical protein BDR05DRAFT_780947 [Suillus weaverae]
MVDVGQPMQALTYNFLSAVHYHAVMPAMRLAPPFFAHACSFCTQCILHDCHCFCNWRVCEYLLSFLCSTPSRLSSWHPALPQDPGGNVLGRLISHVTGVLIYLPVRVTTICASCASFPWFINIIFSVTLDCMVSSLASSPIEMRSLINSENWT